MGIGMCNINVACVLQDISASGASGGNTFPIFQSKRLEEFVDAKGRRRLKPFVITVVVSAVSPSPESKMDAEVKLNVFSFTHKYEIKIRLSETASEKYSDVSSFIIDPSKQDSKEAFNFTHTCLCENISILPKREDEKYAIKLLIRDLEDTDDNKENWTLQAVLPIEVVTSEE